jgi:hypothetical protein
MPKPTKPTKQDLLENLIRETIVSQINDLLVAHWHQVRQWRSESDRSKIIIPLKAQVDTSGAQPVVSCAFGLKKEIKDSAVTVLEDPDQISLGLSDGDDTPDVPEPPKPKRGRPKNPSMK